MRVGDMAEHDEEPDAPQPLEQELLDAHPPGQDLDGAQPSEQNTLHTDEQHYLNHFFDNASNSIDPTIDPTLRENQDTFDAQQNLEWPTPQFPPTTGAPDTKTLPLGDASNGHAIDSHNAGNDMDPMMGPQQNILDDAGEDTQAAQLLQGFSTQSNVRYDGYEYSGQRAPSTTNRNVNHNFPHHSAYPIQSPAYPVHPYGDSNEQHLGNRSSYDPNITTMQASPSGQTRAGQKRPLGLAFGSDANFNRNEYKSPKDEIYPDVSLLNHALAAQIAGNAQNAGDTSPGSAGDMYRGHSGQTSVSYEGDEDQDPSRKRIRTEQYDGEADTPAGGIKGGRRTTNKRASASSPGKRRASAGSPASGGKPPRKNLTDDQKNDNHKRSEQKRRDLQVKGFKDVEAMVPELRTSSASKCVKLLEAARWMRLLKEGNEELRELVQLRRLDDDKG